MAQTPPPSTETPAPESDQASLFDKPVGIVLSAMLLWVVAIFAAAAANVAGKALTIEEPAGRIAAEYLLFLPSCLFFLAGFSALVIGSVRWAMYGKDNTNPAAPRTSDSEDLLRSINDRLLLSDTAKRIAYRQHDLAALRRAIKEDIDHREFDAAMVLVQEMSQTFGYREEAENFRDQILAARAADQERKIDAATAELEKVIAAHDFKKAGLMAARMTRLFPESERISAIIDHVEDEKDKYKLRLEREFLAAAQREELDKAMDLLRELDGYLTEQEAEPFREVARGVIGKKRDNFGVQFKIAVHDKEWTKAVAVGEQIIREFPNTRMADEVRGMLDLLRERAAGERAARA